MGRLNSPKGVKGAVEPEAPDSYAVFLLDLLTLGHFCTSHLALVTQLFACFAALVISLSLIIWVVLKGVDILMKDLRGIESL